MTGNKAFSISKKRVWQTGEFIMQHARDIDKALYAHYFENKPAFAVISVLEGYLNKDGGAGGLEIDHIYEGSTPISCAYFLRTLHELKITQEFDAPQKVLNYLRENVRQNGSWHPTVEEAARSPRAKWLDWDEAHPNNFPLYPTCEIVGYFYHFGGGDFRAFAKEMLENLYNELIQRFAGTLDKREIAGLMQLCRLLPDVAGERFVNVLKPHLKEMIVLDQKSWTNDVISPLCIFKSPLDPLYYDFEKAINQNLDYIILNQPEDGVWEYSGHWDMYHSEYTENFDKLTAKFNLDRLIQLKNFGRITRMSK